MDIRRVVTGHDEQGHSVFVSDELVEPIVLKSLPGSEFHRLWGSDAVVAFPDDGSRPTAERYFPPIGGFRFGYFTIPPADVTASRTDIDAEMKRAELDVEVPGLGEYLEADHPGMHTTASIDFGVVVSGEVILELDDKKRVTLGAGDSYVQNGTRHRWINKGNVPAVIAVVLIGAHHEVVSEP